VNGGAYHRTVRNAVRAWAPVVVWAAVIFAFSSIPSLGTGLGTWDLVLRKLAHLTEYAILGALLVRALARPSLAILLGALYAASDELHQHFVRGRHRCLVRRRHRHRGRHGRRDPVAATRARQDVRRYSVPLPLTA
jgi:hypothetical protein